ncbi:MAG: hypothetical protein SD837_12230 [Candidatus Electrothrix scaldis]|nr:MAG: hypothetical protein SD837_12230 [Candidatus Electrothrix sp. GW3-3]
MMSGSGEKDNIEKMRIFRSALFWDVDIATLDPELHARYIIGRVVTRGDLADWNALKQLYGHQKIREEIVQLRSLDAKTLSFLSCYYDIDRTLFKCCTSTLSNRKL